MIPNNFRYRLFFTLFILESRGKDIRNGLRRIFVIEDYLNLVINERALALGDGTHPKHRLIGYHEFFIMNLMGCQNILDIGCGYGAVARSIAMAYPSTKVLGIDNSFEQIQKALTLPKLQNLSFQLMDLENFEPREKYDAVILSNILEHLDERVKSLRFIISKTQCSKFLIRVPLFERHWTIPMRKELGINYYQDDDHKIEHTIEQFYEEIESAGLRIQSISTKWGEIWTICEK